MNKNKDLEVSKSTFSFLLIMITIFLFICIKYVVEKIKSSLSAFPFILLIGIFSGYICHLSGRGDIVESVVDKELSLFSIVVPVVIFNMCISLDTNLLAKCWGQILTISILGGTLNVIIVAMIFNRFFRDWSLLGFLVAITLVPIYPMDVKVYLKNLTGASKQLLTILQGESLMGACVFFMVQILLIDTSVGRMTPGWDYVFLISLYFIVGISLGLILGNIFSRLMVFLGNQPIKTIMVSILGPFGVYWTAATTVAPGMGLICLTLQGVMVAHKKRRLSKDSRKLLMRFWHCVALTCNSCGLMIFGIIVGYETIQNVDIRDITFILIAYLVNSMARFLQFLSLFYFLKKICPLMTFRHLIVLVWGGIQSVINLSLQAEPYKEPAYRNFAAVILLHGSLTACLTMLINVSTMPHLLNCLELDTVSLIKQANMNKSFKKVNDVRGHWISALKMDRFFCDANWPVISKATLIAHPFKTDNIKRYEELENELQFDKLTICPSCHQEATIISSVKDLDDLILDARRRILKAKQVSYSRQYENGVLEVDAIRVLTHEVETAMENDIIMRIDNIIKLFQPPVHLLRLQRLLIRMFHDKTDDLFVRRPRIWIRKICHIVVFTSAFEYVMCVVILVNTVVVIAQLCYLLTHNESLDFIRTWKIYFRALSFLLFLIYAAEFAMKVLALSSIYIWKDGVVGYFRSKWRKFEFFFLIVSLLVVLSELTFILVGDEQVGRSGSIPAIICCVGFLRIARTAKVAQRLYPFLEKCINNKINSRLSSAYSVGKGYITGEQDVLHLLPSIVLKHELIEEIKQAVDADKLKINIELTNLQRERPCVAVDVKTRESIKTILITMHNVVTELKYIGWISERERGMLKDSIIVQERKLNRLRMVPTPTSQEIFQEISWMNNDQILIRYLYAHCQKITYEAEEFVCLENTYCEGVFIIISGILKMIYKPDDIKLKSLYKFGDLPVIDHITYCDLDTEIEDFLSTGNSFGELAVLVDRPYDCSIVAECRSQVYMIEREFIGEAIKMDDDPMTGLRARLWTTVSLKLAYNILVNAPPYLEVPKKVIEYSLLKAVVPDLDDVAIFRNNYMIEDIVLINGIVADFSSGIIYYAPCYIPRTVEKIVFASTGKLGLHVSFDDQIQTKLLLITADDVDRNKLMSTIKDTAQFVEDFKFVTRESSSEPND